MLIPLRRVFDGSFAFTFGEGLYIQGEAPWSPDSLCAMLLLEPIILDDEPEADGSGDESDAEDWGDDSEVDLPEREEVLPEFAVANKLKYALTSEEVEDVMLNAKDQKENVSIEEIVDALNYYYRYDAFKEIT